MSVRRLAVNVDVDGLALYHAIHGLPSGRATDAAWELGVPRFLELFAELGLRATFFVVASDLERAAPRAVAEQLVAAGHELASHSLSHPYNLIHLPEARIRDEIARAEEPLAELRGAPVAGFRAPGYNISRPVLEVLAQRGYAYDSSLFPCPPYYAARAAVIGLMRLVGRRSRSIVGDPAAAFGRRAPHRTVGGVIEYPITVLPGVRFPVIGTSLTMLGTTGVRAIAPALRRMRFVNLELHAADLLDQDDPVDPRLVGLQRDLRVPVPTKRAAFAAAMRAAAEGSENATLEEMAAADAARLT